MNTVGKELARLMGDGFRKYLVVGHPRSGTGYAAWLLQKHGYDVQHEAMGKDGTSSWQFAVHDADYPFTFDKTRMANHVFDTVIHIVREPLAAIASVMHTECDSEHFRSKYVIIYGTALERAVQSYIGWNRMLLAQRADIRSRTETLNLNLARMLLVDPVEPTRINEREHPPLDEKELAELPHALRFELDKFTEFYYSLP